MPGICASDSQELNQDLQKIGQITSTETGQLVDAIANLELDLEDSKRTNVRLSIREKVLAAEVDDKNTKIQDLQHDLQTEAEKRERAELELKKVLEDLTKLSQEFTSLNKSGSSKDGSSSDQDEAVQVR